jgi:hypothetical protein
MPILDADGTIRYSSPDEFLTDYNTNIVKGGFYLQTDTHWPLRRTRPFDIKIEGINTSATIQAEIVFTGQGKAGLQMQRTPGNQAAVTELLDLAKAFLLDVLEETGDAKLDSPASTEQKGVILLKEDATIFFGSAGDFTDQYDSMLSTSSLYLNTPVDWPLHKSRKFNIIIGGTDTGATITGKAVFGGRGKVGLQIESTPRNQEALAELLARLQGTKPAGKPKPPATTGAEPAAQSGAALETLRAPTEEVSPDALEFQGQIAVARGTDILPSAKPVGIGSEACHSISLLQLIASITTSGLPLALTIALRGQQMSFRFNREGNLVQFLSPDSGGDLLERLVRKQMLAKVRQDEVLKELGPNQFAEAILLKKKYIRLNDLWNVIRDQVVDAFEQIQATAGTSYRINAINTGRKTGVAFGSLVIPWMERTLKSSNPEQLNSMLKPLWDLYPAIAKKPNWPLASFDFDSRGERFINEYLDGVRTLSEAMDIYPIRYRDSACRLVLILRAIGVVEILDVHLGTEDATPEGRLTRELDQLNRQSRFHQAGVHWSAHTNDYPEAMKKLENKYGSSGKLARHSTVCERLCVKRLKLARQALQILKDPAQRKQHRQDVVGEYQMKNSAELLFRQALLQLLKSDIKKARQLLEVAIEFDPQPEYIQKLQSI